MAETLAETSEQELAKQAKIRSGMGATMLKHLAEIAHDDVEDVRRLKRKHLGEHWAGAEGEDVGDVIVCDNYSRDNQQAGRPRAAWPAWLPPLLALALLGGTVAALAYGLGRVTGPMAQPSNPPATKSAGKTEKITNGFLIELID
jgi:hypothetical protein